MRLGGFRHGIREVRVIIALRDLRLAPSDAFAVAGAFAEQVFLLSEVQTGNEGFGDVLEVVPHSRDTIVHGGRHHRVDGAHGIHVTLVGLCRGREKI